MEQKVERSRDGGPWVDEQVARLGLRMLERADELAASLVARIQAAVPAYRTNAVVTTDELLATCRANVDFIFGPIGRDPALQSPESRENGRRRAQTGVPLTAVMDAYRVAARVLWEALAETAAAAGVSADVAIRAASEIWLVQDTFTQEMAEGYREEITSQLLGREQERAAVVQALLEGRLGETNLWEAAEILRLPARGPYVVVAATAPKVGRHALPRAEARLRSAGLASAWRLLHDVEVGIVGLAGADARTERVAEALGEAPGEDAATRMGISPLYNDLRDTANALSLARIALHSATDDRPVTLFDRDPLAIAAASAPEVMRRVAHGVLADLDAIAPSERARLLTTFGAWLDNNGSADQTAAALFCHPNTVRHRLRRLEERTGRSLADPRSVAELSLAFEIDRRMPRTASGQQP